MTFLKMTHFAQHYEFLVVFHNIGLLGQAVDYAPRAVKPVGLPLGDRPHGRRSQWVFLQLGANKNLMGNYSNLACGRRSQQACRGYHGNTNEAGLPAVYHS